jgi:hypothetical protein
MIYDLLFIIYALIIVSLVALILRLVTGTGKNNDRADQGMHNNGFE